MGWLTGLPTRYYTGSEKLGDFSVSPKVYDFSMPLPEIRTEGLRGPLQVDVEKAKELFVPLVRGLSAQSRDEELSTSRPEGEIVLQRDSPEGREQEVASSSPTQLNWALAKRLFIPRQFK